MCEPGPVPTQGTTRHQNDPVTGDPAGGIHDVRRARGAVHDTHVGFGPPPRRPGLGERWRTFAYRYGWRAYALPILAVITVAALLTTDQVTKAKSTTAAAPARQQAAASGSAAPPTAPPSIGLKNDAGGNAVAALKAAALPAGPAYTTKGKGSFKVLPGTSPKVGSGKLYRYSIEVENGVTGVDLTQFQQQVVTVLSDPRSWTGHGVALERVDSGPIDFRVTMTSAMTVRKLCGFDIPVETSCYAPSGNTTPVNRVVFNVARWMRGAAAYVGNVDLYRIYMINHEDGHAVGHIHAHQCLPGGLAPVMMQQTFGLRSAKTGKFCQANPWPYPTSGGKVVAGAPGAEQPDTNGNNEYGKGD
jgi:hypothetical protein